MTNSLEFTIDKNGVANLVFNTPNEKINKLSGQVLIELEKALNVIDGNKAIRLLLISSAKKNIFIAGADINEIKNLWDKEDAYAKVAYGQNIIDKIADLKIPTIAVVNGACMGGGLELALACKYRVGVVNPKTMLALPEVNLGVIPGFGGTQRLPKLVGLEESLKMILSGKAINTEKAFKIGLLDDIVREEFLEEKMSHFVSEILKNGEKNYYLLKRKKAAKKRFLIESVFLKKHLIYYFVKKDLMKKTKGFYKAPLYALEVVKRTYGLTYIKKGLKVELKGFCELAVDKVSKNLIEIFYTSEALKKETGVENFDKIDDKFFVKNAALIGAGVMGGGIAWLFAYKDINIRIKDISQKAISIGYDQINKIFSQLKKIRKLTQFEIDFKKGKISSTLDYSGFASSQIIIEAAVENIEIKKDILAQIEEKVAKDAIIVSNTSSLSISEMSKALKNPERFAGMHFFNPVNRMPLVEIIRGEKTTDETIVKIVQISKKLGKTPIVVKDVAGFLVNRILLPMMNEASYLYQEGGEIENIDRVMENFGMPMGPFVLADIVGIDIGCKVALSLEESYGNRMKVADILLEIHNNHKDFLGKKSGIGFYKYIAGSKKTFVNPQIKEILEKLRGEKSLPIYYADDERIIDRLLLTMVNEAAKCLEEGVVQNARYLDMAMIMGAGFPAFHGGILRYGDNYGIKKVVEKLQKFNSKIGERYEVSNLLIQLANEDKKFYDL